MNIEQIKGYCALSAQIYFCHEGDNSVHVGVGAQTFWDAGGAGFDGWNYLLMDGGGSSIPPILDSPGKHKLTGMDRQTEKGVCHILFLAAN